MQINNEKFSVDKNVSSITWEDTQSANSTKSNLPIKDGFIALNQDEIVGGSFLLDVSEIGSGSKELEEPSMLERHLKSNEVANVKDYPEGKITILSAQKVNENLKTLEPFENEGLIESPTHMLTGDLTLRGETHQVNFPARVNKRGNAISTDAKFKISRSRWGLPSPGKNPEGSKEEENANEDLVTIGFHIEAGETVHRK